MSPFVRRAKIPLQSQRLGPDVADLAGQMDAAGLGLGEVLARAGVARTTWRRWVGGAFEPRASTLRKIRLAIAVLCSERANRVLADTLALNDKLGLNDKLAA